MSRQRKRGGRGRSRSRGRGFHVDSAQSRQNPYPPQTSSEPAGNHSLSPRSRGNSDYVSRLQSRNQSEFKKPRPFPGFQPKMERVSLQQTGRGRGRKRADSTHNTDLAENKTSKEEQNGRGRGRGRGSSRGRGPKRRTAASERSQRYIQSDIVEKTPEPKRRETSSRGRVKKKNAVSRKTAPEQKGSSFPIPSVSPENPYKKRAISDSTEKFISNAVEFKFLYSRENIYKWKQNRRKTSTSCDPSLVIQAFKDKNFELVIFDKENGIVYTNRKSIDTNEFVKLGDSNKVDCLGYKFSLHVLKGSNPPLIDADDYKRCIELAWENSLEQSQYRRMGPIWSPKHQLGHREIKLKEKKFSIFSGIRFKVDIKSDTDRGARGLIYFIPRDLIFYGDLIRDVLIKGDFPLRPPNENFKLARKLYADMDRSFEPPYQKESMEEFKKFVEKCIKSMESDDINESEQEAILKMLRQKQGNIQSYTQKLRYFRDGLALVAGSMKVVSVIRVTDVKTTPDVYAQAIDRGLVLKMKGATVVECDEGFYSSEELLFKARLTMKEQSKISHKMKDLTLRQRQSSENTDSLESQVRCLLMLSGIVRQYGHFGIEIKEEFHHVFPHWSPELAFSRGDMTMNAYHTKKMWDHMAITHPNQWNSKREPKFCFVVDDSFESGTIHKILSSLLEVQKKRKYLPIGTSRSQIQDKMTKVNLSMLADTAKDIVKGAKFKHDPKLRKSDLIFVFLPPEKDDINARRYLAERIQLVIGNVRHGINPSAAVQCFNIENLSEVESLISSFDVGVITKLGCDLFEVTPTRKEIKEDFHAVLAIDVRNYSRYQIISASFSSRPLVASIRKPGFRSIVVINQKEACKCTIDKKVLKKILKEFGLSSMKMSNKNVVIFRNCIDEDESFEEEKTLFHDLPANIVFVKVMKSCSLRLYSSDKNITVPTVIMDAKFGKNKFFLKLPSYGKERDRVETYPTAYEISNISWPSDIFSLENIIYFTRAQTMMYVYNKFEMRVPGIVQYTKKQSLKFSRLIRMFPKNNKVDLTFSQTKFDLVRKDLHTSFAFI